VIIAGGVIEAKPIDVLMKHPRDSENRQTCNSNFKQLNPQQRKTTKFKRGMFIVTSNEKLFR
jgi:hypothetical protein